MFIHKILFIFFILKSAKRKSIAFLRISLGTQRIAIAYFPKVGEGPTVRSSDIDTDLPIVSADLFHEF
jgi:hypothetical protein